MTIVGCDLHTRKQQVAVLHADTGEVVEQELERIPANIRTRTQAAEVAHLWSCEKCRSARCRGAGRHLYTRVPAGVSTHNSVDAVRFKIALVFSLESIFCSARTRASIALMHSRADG
jgi:hypothetical protein